MSVFEAHARPIIHKFYAGGINFMHLGTISSAMAI